MRLRNNKFIPAKKNPNPTVGIFLVLTISLFLYKNKIKVLLIPFDILELYYQKLIPLKYIE